MPDNRDDEKSFFDYLFDALSVELEQRCPIDRPDVPSVTQACLVQMVEKFGGEQVYLPRHKSKFTRARDDEIVKRFGGRNYRSLARDFGLTERRIREIVNRARNDHKAKE